MFSRSSFRLALIATCLLVNQVSALNVDYCSSINTASTNKSKPLPPPREKAILMYPDSSIYQSNGLCQTFCQSSYAFAVVQDDGCWCSNYVPGTTTSGCTMQCPGYPDDLCGGNGLYGYIALGKAASGTKGGSSAAAASSTTQQQSSTATQVTVTATPNAVTVTNEPPSSQAPSSSPTFNTPTTTAPSNTITPTVIQSPPSSSPSSSPSPSSTLSTSMTWTPTPIVSLETTTGSVRTVTITPTVPPDSQNLAPVSKKPNSGGLTTGGAVGLTIGLVAVVAIISGIIFVCIKKHRQEKEAEAYNDISRRGSSAGLGGAVPSRTMSENSRYVLGTNGRDVVETWEPDENGPPGSRRSRLMPVDPRLDPFAPVYQLGQNKSRESVNTLRDDHDYSRRVHQQGPILRATNPDE